MYIGQGLCSYAICTLTCPNYSWLSTFNIYTLMCVQKHIHKWTSQVKKKILKDFLLVLSSHWWKGHNSYYHTSQLIHLHPNLFLIRLNVWCFWARFSPIVAKYFGGNEYTLLFCNDGNRIGDILIFPILVSWYRYSSIRPSSTRRQPQLSKLLTSTADLTVTLYVTQAHNLTYQRVADIFHSLNDRLEDFERR